MGCSKPPIVEKDQNYVSSSAQLVWDDLFERFNKVDSSQTYNLHKEITTFTQGTTSDTIQIAFGSLHRMLTVLEVLDNSMVLSKGINWMMITFKEGQGTL
ncbi:hypothetical protein P3S67_022785 [Capsicum chacoense]